ncbi:MAG: hypothetical protein KGH49_00735 [Candidatus Micrarchaeota archaeon]|nr:hypothetical protein [Candidatus Micrarchaeota archaeon]
MPDLSQKEKMSVISAMAVVVLSAAAIAAFVYTGGSLLFYIIAIIAVAFGFYITYALSRSEEEPRRARKK